MVAGDVAVIPGNTEHEGISPEDTEVIDIFAPPREDFLTNDLQGARKPLILLHKLRVLAGVEGLSHPREQKGLVKVRQRQRPIELQRHSGECVAPI
jgi:hypothetical protein